MAKKAVKAYLTTSQVTDMFAAAGIVISPKTVNRWAKAGKLPSGKTLGGHRRYPTDEIKAVIDGLVSDRDQGGQS